MSVYQKIEKLLSINKMTIPQLAKISGVPSNTIYSLKKRDSKRINLETLKKISDGLGVNINYFAGVNQQGTIVLTKEEEELILKIRGLDCHGLKVVCSVIDLEIDRVSENAEIKYELNVDGNEQEKSVIVNIDELNDALNEIK